jgi:NAD(P)-dependent dehydrogenase (short-subunit alcohol dehydrogenase family)
MSARSRGFRERERGHIGLGMQERGVAIVTGASRGIGAGLVAGYRELGFRVVATSRSIAPSGDERVLAIAGDIRDSAGLAALSKGGLNALTKSLAIEVAKRGVRVNAVAPGIIKTPMHAPATHDFLATLMPIGRLGEVKDVVEAVLYLECASFVTGEIVHVDGGEAAGVG